MFFSKKKPVSQRRGKEGGSGHRSTPPLIYIRLKTRPLGRREEGKKKKLKPQ